MYTKQLGRCLTTTGDADHTTITVPCRPITNVLRIIKSRSPHQQDDPFTLTLSAQSDNSQSQDVADVSWQMGGSAGRGPHNANSQPNGLGIVKTSQSRFRCMELACRRIRFSLPIATRPLQMLAQTYRLDVFVRNEFAHRSPRGRAPRSSPPGAAHGHSAKCCRFQPPAPPACPACLAACLAACLTCQGLSPVLERQSGPPTGASIDARRRPGDNSPSANFHRK